VGVKKQDRCQKLGVLFMTVGIVAMVFKTVPIVFFGLILIMFGFRLMSNGLDRLDKNIYNANYDENNIS
jgi:Na+/phosphate symporter